ncbi:MAG: hypothetical protein AAGC46_20430, partial [Solirubrobacteraceae bacterium]|nr:hypothetical protein [Patulibacter sp.]
FGLGINEQEREWLKDVVFADLNATISDAATIAGITYIDITRATKGHEICSDDEWVNGLASGDDQYGAIGNESFHPNQYAHDAIAKFFEQHYVDPQGRLLFSNPAPADVLAPAAGQQIAMGHADASPANGCAKDCAQPRGCIQDCALRIQGDNFSPDTTVSLRLAGPGAITVKARSADDPNDLGSFTTDDDGGLDVTVQLPDGIPTGRQSIDITGVDASGVRQYGTALFVVYEHGLPADHVDDPQPTPDPTPTPTPPSDPEPTPTPSSAAPITGAVAAPGTPLSAPTAAPVTGPRLVLLGWKGRAMRLQVTCPATATKGCQASLVVTRNGKTVGRYPKKGKVTLKAGAVKTYRITLPRSVRSKQTVSVRLGALIAGKLATINLTKVAVP